MNYDNVGHGTTNLLFCPCGPMDLAYFAVVLWISLILVGVYAKCERYMHRLFAYCEMAVLHLGNPLKSWLVSVHCHLSRSISPKKNG